MFQSFITSLDNNEPTLKFKKEQLVPCSPKDAKLKDVGKVRKGAREATRKETLIPVNQDSLTKISSHDKLKQAIEEELAVRNRLKHYNSTDKQSKKQEILKKRVEKAKSMNKRAFKVYNNHKEKEEKSYDFFKIETLYHNSQTEMIKPPPKLHLKKYISSSQQSQAEGKSLETLKISLMKDDTPNTFQCKTAGVKTRTRYIFDNQSQSIIKRISNDRFFDYKRKQQQTREKKMELERSKEELSLYRLIQKNQRLQQLQLKNQQEQEKQFKKVQKLHQQSLNKHPSQQLHEDFDVSIRDRCQQKAMRKQMQLQEQVNRIRQNQRTRQERRERHKVKLEKQHYQKMSLNEVRLKNQIGRSQIMKENDHRHQMTIKQRHQMLQEKENEAKIINTLSKFTEEELQRSLQRLNKTSPAKPTFNPNLA